METETQDEEGSAAEAEMEDSKSEDSGEWNQEERREVQTVTVCKTSRAFRDCQQIVTWCLAFSVDSLFKQQIWEAYAALTKPLPSNTS